MDQKKNKKIIGIVGGGQLGRMLTQAGHKLGFKIIVLDPTPNSPAGQIADRQIVGDFKDREKILELASVSDFMTFEIESADNETLQKIKDSGMPVNPNPETLRIIKDKFKQKAFLQEHNIPVAPFALVGSMDDALKQGEIFSYPYLLKARFDAYDGRGNCVVNSKKEIESAFQKLSQSPLYAEKFIKFKKELAVVSARDVYGRIVSFPVVETIHKNNICHIVKSPAPIEKETREKAEGMANKVLDALRGVGVFGIEMFLTTDGEILVNEIAPRVHNSGHHTIEAFNASQFEQHIRAITGMHLLDLEPLSKHAVMINILGERESEAEPKGIEEAESLGYTKAHIYGKVKTKVERKMGHITVLSDNLDEAEAKAVEARKKISI
ncbi:MAG: 5-(carboxyamino)imidazole ribonucleotide synthase [Candidatus Pacebacteria bacterium]|nr:5-(carboxyamino)imidazole ribonucleotide synthase [Candidatus Paceibacterota bacterium]MCF7863054.1 5-(carboxyamino)imidazole ribonucleotide synthase [Candidatus Paceibacterota bacterium]